MCPALSRRGRFDVSGVEKLVEAQAVPLVTKRGSRETVPNEKRGIYVCIYDKCIKEICAPVASRFHEKRGIN